MAPGVASSRSRWARWFKSILRIVESAPGLDLLAPAVELDALTRDVSLGGIDVIAYPTSDLNTSVQWWEQYLGVSPHLVTATVVVFRARHVDVVVVEQWDLPEGGLACWCVEDVSAALDDALARGATVRFPLSVIGNSLEIAGVTTSDGVVVGYARRLGSRETPADSDRE